MIRIAFLLLLLTGCGDSRADVRTKRAMHAGGPDYSTISYMTSTSVTVVVQFQLSLHWPKLVREVLDRVRQAKVPSGYTVWVLQPGAFPCRESPTGYAMGQVNTYTREIWVSLRRIPGQGKLVPALEHEVDHIHNGPLAGHK